MHWHPTDDDLVLRYYRDAGADLDARIAAHLAACPACDAAYADLRATLDLVAAAQAPEPDAGFERVMWARVRQALPPRRAGAWRWLPAAALAAAVMLAVAGVAQWARRTDPGTGAAPAPAEARAALTRDRVLFTALDGHLLQSELVLVELMNAAADNGRPLAFEREAAGELVASGRLYRMTAHQAGHLELVRVLDDLESVLVEVARAPAGVTAREVAPLRERIDAEGLLFKVRVVTSEIRERQRDLWTVSEGLQ